MSTDMILKEIEANANKLTGLYTKLGERRSLIINKVVKQPELDMILDDIREFKSEISRIEKDMQVKFNSLRGNVLKGETEPENSLYNREVQAMIYNYDSCLL